MGALGCVIDLDIYIVDRPILLLYVFIYTSISKLHGVGLGW